VNTPGNDVLLLATPKGVEANLAVTTFGVKIHANAIRGCRVSLNPGVVSLNPRLTAVISPRYPVALAKETRNLNHFSRANKRSINGFHNRETKQICESDFRMFSIFRG
jgi:hypothetical protein